MITMLLGCLASAATASELVTLSGRAMGTTWSVKFAQPARPLEPAETERAVAARLEQLEQVFSTYRPQSALSRFNSGQGTDWVPVAPELARVADESRRISELTGGAFDVTVNPLVQLWGFGATRRVDSPSEDEIVAARARVNWRRLEIRLEPPALRKAEADTTVDLSSMAKGFAADSLSDLLTVAGAKNHLVQVGGDMKASGPGPSGDGWRVAIEQSSERAGLPRQMVALNNAALSTSGDYRNFFVVGGRRYGHIIDPRRGEPVSGALESVSVVHASCSTSSALATALFVLGTQEGYRLAAEERLACLFLVREGDTVKPRPTPQFEATFKE